MKKFTAIILCLVMMLTLIPVTSFAYDGTQYKTGDIITFGSYPQDLVEDDTVKAALDGSDKTWVSYNYYTGTGSWGDGKMTPSDYMKYADIEYNGTKYRAVTFSQYRPCYTESLSTAENSHQIDNGYPIDTVCYFEYKPLTWKMLDPEEGYVVCTQIIDSQAYQNFVCSVYDEDENDYYYYNNEACDIPASTRESSSLRKWLNEDFYNTAFSENEKSQIGTTYVSDKYGYSYTDSYDGDKIFLLTVDDYTNPDYGFNSESYESDSARQLKGTQYAKCQGMFVEDDEDNEDNEIIGNSYWWLCTPCEYEYVFCSDSYGSLSDEYITYTDVGVVPAFKFNPEKPYEITIEYKLDGGAWAQGFTPTTKLMSYELASFELPEMDEAVINGAYLGGWSLNADSTDSHLIYVANWTQLGTIIFKFDNGEDDKTIVAPVGTSIDYPIPRKEGYYFDGWDSAFPEKMPEGETTFTAQWVAKTPTLYFYPQNGVWCIEITGDYGTAVEAPVPTKKGYTFKGWDKTVPATMPSKSQQFWAVWEKNQYTVRFVLDNGEADIVYTDDYYTEIAVPTPEKEGYTFIGWDKKVSSYIEEDITYTAQWKINEPTITFDFGNGKYEKITAQYGTPITAPTPTRTGHTFTGWDITVPATMPAEDITITAQWTADYAYGTIIEFGSYPQSQVAETETELLAALEQADKQWNSYKYYTGSGSDVDGKMAASDFMWYADIEYNNAKYRAVKFSQYRPWTTYMTSSADNSNQDENGYESDKVYYFKFEPIKWQVIDPDEGYIMCKDIIDAQAYNNYILKSGDDYYNSEACDTFATDWKTSSLRQWLNNDFYNTAFTSEEKSKIGKTYNTNESVLYTGAVDTEDNIFPISYFDAKTKKYGFDSGSSDTEDTARQKTGTAYAKIQGMTVAYNGNSSWWTRTAWNCLSSESGSYDGSLRFGYVDKIEGVVPALKFYPNNPKEITVTYELNGGDWATDYEAPTSYMSNKELSQPTADNVKRFGYDFKGWELTVNTETTQTYKAKWERTYYTVYFDYNYDDYTESGRKQYGDKLEYSWEPCRDGYTFVGWEGLPETMPAHDITITAKWEINHHTITYDYDYGNNKITEELDYGSTITVPELKREGYTFDGWLWDETVPETMPDEDLYFIAHWTLNEYTLKFVLDNGEDDIEVKKEYDYEITTPVPTKEGYRFVGWDKKVPFYMPAEDVTYTAQWQVKQYTLTFGLDNGEDDVELTQDYGTAVTAPTPTKEGYTFTGWNNTVPATMPAYSESFVANWSINKYTLRFVLGNGEDDVVITEDYGTALSAPVPVKDYCTFDGWDKSVPTSVPAENATYTAKWKGNTYAVKYELNGGTNADGNPENYTYGTGVAELLTPTRENYTFMGWTLDGEAVTAVSATQHDDITLVANWKLSQSAPSVVPEIESLTDDSITIKPVEENENGAKPEYSIDGGKTWQEDNVFTDLDPDTEYTVAIRYGETDTYAPSSVGESTVITTDSDDSSSGGVRMFYWLKWLLEYMNKLMAKMFDILGWAY